MIIAVSVLITAIFALDQVSKFFIVHYLGLGKTYSVIKGIFHLTPILNKGGGFGIFPDQTFIFIIISVATIAFLSYILIKRPPKEKIFLYSVSIVLAGALGNLVDRIRLGAVVDFLDFRIWPIFNIADSCITIGAVLLAYCLWKNSK